MIDLKEYIGIPIVLITNEYDSSSQISGIRLPGIFNLSRLKNNKFILCRDLTTKDLETPEFVSYLNSMWTNEETLRGYLHTMEIIKTYI